MSIAVGKALLSYPSIGHDFAKTLTVAGDYKVVTNRCICPLIAYFRRAWCQMKQCLHIGSSHCYAILIDQEACSTCL